MRGGQRLTSRAYVLLTAMPPTKGHLRLIQYATKIAPRVEVHLQTQPGEPFVKERYDALVDATRHLAGVSIHSMHKTLPQEPDEAAESKFWDMWAGFLREWGITSEDYIVGSEKYGVPLARYTGATFMPYDMGRTILDIKAQHVREDPLAYFDTILPEFQPVLRKTVTVFGAESTGKTTLAQALSKELGSTWIPEWARPYLETVTSEITWESMRDIWYGQRALQDHAREVLAVDSRVLIQDTDLYSTLGYWDAGLQGLDVSKVPAGLAYDAAVRRSDLYIITPSNIDFEEDPIRYGGDHRELETDDWIRFAKLHSLNYVVLSGNDLDTRVDEAVSIIINLFDEGSAPLRYKREGKEYA